MTILCCGFHKIVSLYQVCVSVPKLHVHACPYCFSCWYEGLITNNGDVVKFIAVPSVMCVNFVI